MFFWVFERFIKLFKRYLKGKCFVNAWIERENGRRVLVKMKLRPLMPSLREKKRYLAFEVETDNKFDFKDVKDSIENSMKRFIGELGMAKAGIIFMKDWKNNRGIIKVNTKSVDELKAAIALTTNIKEEKIIIKSLTLSGSIEKVRNQCF